MNKIIWEHYLADEDDVNLNPLAATNAQLNEIEAKLSLSIPKAMRELLIQYAGMEPTNLNPIFPNGKRASLNCINHTNASNKEDIAYYFDFTTQSLKDDGYKDLLCFSFKGNVFYCLDYSESTSSPSVVVIFRDYSYDNPKHKFLLASNFEDFLEKYTTDIN